MATDRYRAQLIGGPTPEGEVQITSITGADLNQTYVGKFLGRADRGYNGQGKILELIPVITDPSGLWLATIRWGQTPASPAETERIQIPFSMPLEIVEITAS